MLIYHFNSRWVLHGELHDPFEEFFISTNSPNTKYANAIYTSFSLDVSNIDYVWHKYYSLNPNMLPPFISLQLAKKILVVGKSINFLKACSKYSERLNGATNTTTSNISSKGTTSLKLDSSLTHTSSSTTSTAPIPIEDTYSSLIGITESNTLKSMSYGNEGELEQVVFSIARVIESTLLNMVQNQFHLSVHLSALKKFLLLGQVISFLII